MSFTLCLLTVPFSLTIHIHRLGKHEYCQIFTKLEEDLRIRKIPFDNAESMLEMEISARKHKFKDAHRDVEVARRYWPWESRENWEACIREIRTLDKPMLDAREKHLDEIEKLYIRWREQIREAELKNDYEAEFEIETEPQFWNLSEHSFEVGDKFGRIRSLRTFTPLNRELTSKEITEKCKAISALGKAIDYTLKNNSYRNKFCSGCFRHAE